MNALQTAQMAHDYAVPDSYYIDNIARERAGEAAFEEYLACGILPNGLDAGTVDEMLLDRMPDCLHELTVASQKISAGARQSRQWPIRSPRCGRRSSTS